MLLFTPKWLVLPNAADMFYNSKEKNAIPVLSKTKKQYFY